METSGPFETHLTLAAVLEHPTEAARWAAEAGLKFTHIELDRGETPSQPMVTFHGRGSLEEAHAAAERWSERLTEAGFEVTRTKIEVPHDDRISPRTREAAASEPEDRYFETHIKLLLPPRADLEALARVVEPYRARLSRNARRLREDGHQERFVTQRCSRVGYLEAMSLSFALRDALIRAGVSIDGRESPGPRTLSTEREYVVYDSAVSVDAGWLGTAVVHEDEKLPRSGIDPTPHREPDTYLPNTTGPGVEQGRVFDPALKQVDEAFTAGEPVFVDPDLSARWWCAQERAMGRALRAITATPWRDHLVLRGGMTMPLWVGESARRSRDLDFVVVPSDMAAFGEPATSLLSALVTAVSGADGDGIAFDADDVRQEGIWTYERAQGRRIVVPWRSDGLPPGTVQLDVVFNEPLPVDPVTSTVAGTEVWTAGPELSLAWKVQWLFTDTYPQGKDLYDAVLLAERTPLSRDLLLSRLRPELEEEAERIDETALRGSGGMGFGSQEWDHFVRECPWVEGEVGEWIDRFEAALAPTFQQADPS